MTISKSCYNCFYFVKKNIMIFTVLNYQNDSFLLSNKGNIFTEVATNINENETSTPFKL